MISQIFCICTQELLKLHLVFIEKFTDFSCYAKQVIHNRVDIKLCMLLGPLYMLKYLPKLFHLSMSKKTQTNLWYQHQAYLLELKRDLLMLCFLSGISFGSRMGPAISMTVHIV